MERQWKLGEDMGRHDALFDAITFDEIILAVHCNAKVINKRAIQDAINTIMEIRMEDFDYILNNNIDEIIVEAKKGRE